MEALYTETLLDYLASKPEGYLGEILADFPTFSFDGNDVDFTDMFRLRFGLCEIGSETPYLFDHNLRRKAQEVYVACAPKLKAFLDQIETLTDRSVADTDTTTTYDYINPMNKQAVDNGQARLAGSQKTVYEKRYFVNSVSPAEQIKEIADLYRIYNDTLEEFDVLFMGVH